MSIRVEPLKIYYLGLHKPVEFNWFMFGSIYEDNIKLKYIELSPKIQLFSERTGKNYTTVEHTKIILMDCLKNIKILKNNDVMIECNSKKEILSNECDIVNYPNKILSKVLEMGYDGIVLRHECDQGDACVSECVAKDVIFFIKENNLNLTKEECGFVTYAKKNNTAIREKYKNFPSYEDIEKNVQIYGCNVVNKALYEYMQYFI